MFNGKIHYKWPFSIAMLNYQRVSVVTHDISCYEVGCPFIRSKNLGEPRKKPSRAKDEDWRTEIMTSAKWSLNMNWHFGFSEHFSFPDARGVWKIIFSSKYIRPSGWSDECLDSLWIFSAQWWFQVIRWTRLWHGTVPPSNPMMEDMDHHGSSWIIMDHHVCMPLVYINHH